MPHLLLVDDDDLFRESLGLNLIDEGYEVTSVGNGQDALAYLEGGGAADVRADDVALDDVVDGPRPGDDDPGAEVAADEVVRRRRRAAHRALPS